MEIEKHTVINPLD